MPKLELRFYFSLSANGITSVSKDLPCTVKSSFFNIFISTSRYLLVTLVKKKEGKVKPRHLEM